MCRLVCGLFALDPTQILLSNPCAFPQRGVLEARGELLAAERSCVRLFGGWLLSRMLGLRQQLVAHSISSISCYLLVGDKATAKLLPREIWDLFSATTEPEDGGSVSRQCLYPQKLKFLAR